MRLYLVLALALVACGDGKKPHRSGPDPLPNNANVELTSGASHVQGTRFAADVQIGHGLSQQPATGASHSAEGNAGVKP